MPPTFGVSLLQSIKATRAIPQVELPTQVILICDKLTLKPVVTNPKVATQFWVFLCVGKIEGVSLDLYTLSNKFTGKRNVLFLLP